jgi:hypothetical protein
VDLQVHRVLADLTAFGQEPVDQLVAPGAGHDRPLFGEDGCASSPQRDPAEAGDQWLSSPVAFDVTCRHFRGPAGVSMAALYLRATELTVERCLPAWVFSSEVSMTQWSCLTAYLDQDTATRAASLLAAQPRLQLPLLRAGPHCHRANPWLNETTELVMIMHGRAGIYGPVGLTGG